MIILGIIFILLNILVYIGTKVIYDRFCYPILVPIATSTLILVVFLTLTHIPYQTYMVGGQWIDELLGPAVVALAYPLYHNRNLLKKYFLPVVIGVCSGSLIGMLSGIFLSKLFFIDEQIILAIAPKSVTTPVAMDVTKVIGGNPSLSAAFVLVAGITGAIFGPYILKKSRITHFIGISIGLGTSSHGLGTSKALEIGKTEAAISSVAMTLSALFTAIVCPYLIQFFLY